MKVAIFSESSADEAAIRILIDALLGRQTQQVALRLAHGWPFVKDTLPAVLKELYYRTDTEALIIVADSDNSPHHQSAHDLPDGMNDRCRLCQLRMVVSRTQAQLRYIAGRLPIKTAIGIAIPAIEAWYRCGIDPHATEAHFFQVFQISPSGLFQVRRQLKRDVYGTERILAEKAIEEATRLATMLKDLETLFPNGFGPLARDVRNW